MLELLPLESGQAKNLFTQMRLRYQQEVQPETAIPDDEDAAITELLEELQGLPLGIEQMAAYIGADQLSVKSFLDKYRSMPKVALKRNFIGLSTTHNLDTLWRITFKRISDSNPAAYNLLAMMSMIGADDIPIKLISNSVLSFQEGVLTEFTEFCEDEEV